MVIVLWLMTDDFVVSCCCGCLWWCVWHLVWCGCVIGSVGIVGLLLLRCCLFNICMIMPLGCCSFAFAGV